MNGYTVYLLHISPPYKHAGHYVGITRNGREVALRWREHMRGNGSVLTKHARKAGCQLILTRIWRNAEFALEAKLKGRGLAPICPVCRRKRVRGRRVTIHPAPGPILTGEKHDERRSESANGNSGAFQ